MALGDDSWRRGRGPGKREQLHAATFLPLHGASNLAILDIAHRFPVRMNDDELMELVQALPVLAVLSLNPAPVLIDATSLTLRVLDRLARVRPHMEVVRLYLDATLNDHEASLTREVNRFEDSLRSLWLDASPITMKRGQMEDVAYYLSMVLPLTKTLDDNMTLPKGVDVSVLYFWDDVPPVSSERVQAWHAVAGMIEPIRHSLDKHDALEADSQQEPESA